MSVSGIFSSNFSNNQAGVARAPYQLTSSQFQQLGQDLQSGNVSAAQSEFAALQQAFTKPATVSSSSSSNPLVKTFQQLATDLKSGDLAAAKQDYSTIQRGLQNEAASGRFQYRHHIGVGRGFDPNNPLQNVNQLGHDVSSTGFQSASVAAQLAYAGMQAVALGGTEASSTGSSSGHNMMPPTYSPPTSSTMSQYYPEPPIYSAPVSFVA